MNKVFEKGQSYRPVAKVEKVKKGKPTVLIIRGERYILDHKDRGRGK